MRTPYSVHENSTWRYRSRCYKLLLCLTLFLCFMQSAAVDVSAACNHSRENWVFIKEDSIYCTQICKICREEITTIRHDWNVTISPSTPHYEGSKHKVCSNCGFSVITSLDTPSTDMNSFAFNVYKTICRISIPMAILSFAFCGYKILGPIFFGAGNPATADMQKAQKQFLYTVLYILFVILLPHIFSAAISMFEDTAWTP